MFLIRFHDHFLKCNPPSTNKDHCRPLSKLICLPPLTRALYMTILWLTDTFTILWPTDTFYIVFCYLQTHFLLCDLHTLLTNGKAGATAKHLWDIWLYTVDPVGAKHLTKIDFEKIFLLMIINWLLGLFCDLQTGCVRVTWDAYFSETQRRLAYCGRAKQKFNIFESEPRKKERKNYTHSFQTSMYKWCKYFSEPTELNDMYLTLSKNHIKN